ncbi:3-dehydroquinate dehydratase II [Patulibacter medicamentivorans]|jgi:3-dehydroquinate dehydratase-2|uniref:3-dehydroquinate dehydratase n=1 Tax=Patulibacter medicamentivorans TaxID=1097667 RepID=H0EC60_9ACTN|nr:type II 3-dehydroquinate dehydratase [Patulibacter medicamentivorans]EHN08732.1 3-dehydroquinate dehydratase II [Patulibacter medicamentivorans]
MRRFRVAVVHGVNLDQLGRRDPAHYGGTTFRDLERQVADFAGELDLIPRFFQTNYEGALVEYLHRAEGLVDGIVINPGAWTHYAWAIRDALELSGVPAVEVHLSDVSKREPWRHHSVIAALCIATITGRGAAGYRDALEILRDELRLRQPEPEPTPAPVAAADRDVALAEGNAAPADEEETVEAPREEESAS